MELELRFDGLVEELLDAEVDVQIQDLALADAPPEPTVTTASHLCVTPDHPSARITLDLPADGGHEPGLLVRVRGRTTSAGPVEFFNTGATPMRGGPSGPVHVVLSRIR